MKIRLSLNIVGALLLVALISTEATSAVVQEGSPSEWPVVDAAQRGDVAALRELIRQGADANQASGDGMTALHWAAERGETQVATLLLGAGGDVHAGTRIGSYTPLHLASRSGTASVVKVLLEAGSDANATTTNSRTSPLHLAARAGNPEAVGLLLDHGADIHAREPEWGHTPLFFAADRNRAAAIKVLLKRGADPEMTAPVIDVPHRAAVDQASARTMWESLSQFQQEEAEASGNPERLSISEISSGGQWRPTPGQLRVAIEAMRDFQLAGEANLEEEQAFNRPAFFGDDGDALSSRVKHSKAKLVGTMGGLTALHHAARNGFVEATLALLDGGADINGVSAADGSSPLLVAAVNGQFDLAMVLLERGADHSLASSHTGLRPLYAVIDIKWSPKSHYAQPPTPERQRVTHLELMKALLDAGADPNARLQGDHQVWYTLGRFDPSSLGASPFYRSALALDVDAMRMLVAYGADHTVGTKKAPPRPIQLPQRVLKVWPDDPTGLDPIPVGGPAAHPVHAATGLEYGLSSVGNTHRFVPDNWLNAVKYLVEELGHDVNARDDKGTTPLHNAAARGDNELILYLIEQGADVMIVNRRAQSVADFANGPHIRAPPLPETVRLLESLGSINNHHCITC